VTDLCNSLSVLQVLPIAALPEAEQATMAWAYLAVLAAPFQQLGCSCSDRGNWLIPAFPSAPAPATGQDCPGKQLDYQ